MAHISNEYKLGDLVIYNNEQYRVKAIRRITTSIPYTIWDYEYDLKLIREPREGELSVIRGVNERAISRKVDDKRKEHSAYYRNHRVDDMKMEEIKMILNNKYGIPKFEYKKIIFNGPCTIILWKDGTKTIAKTSSGDAFDPEKGVAICFMKKVLGHTETNKVLRKASKDFYDEIARVANIQLDEELRKATFPPKGVIFRPFNFDVHMDTNKVIKVAKEDKEK